MIPDGPEPFHGVYAATPCPLRGDLAPDEPALAAGTAALQAELTREGWEPLRRPAPRWRPAAAAVNAAGD